MASVQRRLLLTGHETPDRFARSLNDIAAIAGLWLPGSDDVTTTVSPSSGTDSRVWTEANATTGRKTPRGSYGGIFMAYNGTDDRSAATDDGLPATNRDRTLIALIRPTAINVTDNPIFTYGTAAAKQAIAWELASAKQRVGVYGTVSDQATTSQAVGRIALIGANFDGVDTFSFFNNGVADGTATAIASVNTTLGGAGEAVVGDFNSGVWGVGNTGNVTTAFVVIYSSALTAAQHLAVKYRVNHFFGLSL